MAPSIDDISTAIDHMLPNGLSPKKLIQKGNPLYTFLMTHHAPCRPLALYTVASRHGLEALAQDTSAHLLALEVGSIDDASAVEMGSTYFMRLITLSTSRVKALKGIVRDTNPALHTLERGKACNKERQQDMRNLWVRTVIKLTWDPKSDISPRIIRQACHLAAEDVRCSICRQCWNDCVEQVAIQWVQVKFTI
ncbi:hypothetical protein BKA70DRAFT_411828 [Coprinopsis sp. MPI-PUGE-AT-0042]|nr:hypothetical protein BKA70DRAFT_411828 [Coprinopsis sp. MPI-PUGE-AT-0042]